MALNNLSNRLRDLGRSSEAERRFAEVLGDYASDAWATGVLLLSRARWHRRNRDLASAIDDAWTSVQRLAEGNDLLRRGEARSLLRSLRSDDPAAFDRAWAERIGIEQALWLRHQEDDEHLSNQLVQWIGATTWDESQSFLAAHSAELLTDQAEATLEHLIDANPGRPALLQHLKILQAARSHGIEAAYAALHESLSWQSVTELLIAWVQTQTRSWDESRSFMEEHAAELLSDHGEDVLQSLIDQNPEVLELIAHLGLLVLCRSDGIEAAYGMLEDSEGLRQSIDEAFSTQADPLRTMALARLHAGLRPDDGDAHFTHAVAAVAAGSPQEAERAIVRCADVLASWERRSYARRLLELADTRPDLAEGLGRLRTLLSNPMTPS
jgi:hypothetical protein